MEVPDAEAARGENQALLGQEEERTGSRDSHSWGHKPAGALPCGKGGGQWGHNTGQLPGR